MNRYALLISLVLGLVSATLLLLYMRKFERETSGGERVELLVAVKPIPRGTFLTESMLSVRQVPLAYVETRAIKARERSKVIGLPAAVSLEASQTLLWTDLAIRTEERELSSLVQPGKRALTVLAGGSSDHNGNALIRPGDYVDVLSTVADERSGEPSTIVLLQRILVLAVGMETQAIEPMVQKPEAGHRDNSKALTLSLNLREAQLVTLATGQGPLSVVVRPPDEQTVQDDVPDIKASALLDNRARNEVQQVSLSPSHPIKIEATP